MNHFEDIQSAASNDFSTGCYSSESNDSYDNSESSD